MAGRQFLVDGLKGISVLPTNSEDEENARTLILQRRDKSYSLCDAISFSVMERFGLYPAFAYDDHFRQHGFSTPIRQREWPWPEPYESVGSRACRSVRIPEYYSDRIEPNEGSDTSGRRNDLTGEVAAVSGASLIRS